MRIDRFLKISRLVRRRTIARELCLAGAVLINGRPAKPGTRVEAGDELAVDAGRLTFKVRVLAVPETRTPRPEDLYETIS